MTGTMLARTPSTVREYLDAARKRVETPSSGLDICARAGCGHIRMQHPVGGQACAHPDCKCGQFAGTVVYR